jgi:gag-polypeptide of LTR copia-type
LFVTDGMDSAPVPTSFGYEPGEALKEDQKEALKEYKYKMKWEMEENIVKQALVSVILNSLFIEVRRKETVVLMWDGFRDQREKKSHMVTMDMCQKLQSEKCNEQGDVRVHLIKLQTMREDLAFMGGLISDEDFMSGFHQVALWYRSERALATGT